jgi:serine O-acetyltransferase
MTLKEYLKADWARLAKLCQLDPAFAWRRCLNPRFAPVVIVRIAYCLYRAEYIRLAKLFSALNLFMFGLEVPSKLNIGPGLILPHTVGTVLGGASIGINATIFHQVTLGAIVADYQYDLSARPIVGDNVTITVGAKVLGAIHLGNGCVVGANAVVLNDVPANMLSVGVPAKNVMKNFVELRS